MSAPRTLLVVNPKSQNGSLGRRWPELSKIVRRELGGFEEIHTKAPGDATELTRRALRDGVERIVAIGGDGTINEVTNGFFDQGEAIAPGASLGILPFGTGGDFRKTALIPKDMKKASAILARGKTRSVDVGRLSYTTHEGETDVRMFLNIASFGMSGEVDKAVNSSSKRLGGKLTFLLASTKVGLSYKAKRVRLSFDDDAANALETDIHLVAVANGKYFGGGMFIAPNADLSDGRFDVVAIEKLSKMELALNGRRLYEGTHLGLDKVSSRRATKVQADPVGGDEVLLDVDGEQPGRLPATFEVLPSALELVVP